MISAKFFERKLIFGLVSIVFSVVLCLNRYRIYQLIIDTAMIINPNHKYPFYLWKETPFDITTDFYFFNWTNPEDIKTPGVKPRLQELGPYRFKENKQKVDVVWHNNGTITFKPVHYWHFDAENSVGSLDDVITQLDPVALSAAAVSKNFNYIIKKTLSLSFASLNTKIHIRKKVREFLFEGYSDPLVNIAQSLPPIPGLEVPPFNRFGWFVERNGSKDYEGTFTMGTGENKSVKFGELYEWNGARTNRFYSGECSKNGGSAGEFFSQNVPRTEVQLFFADMCRSISLQYEKEDVFNHIGAYRYRGGEKTFENGTKYPENKCYCDDECIPSGLTSVQKCRYGAPGYISFPHFYEADPMYLEAFEGLEPNKEKHEFYVLVEPRTGIPLLVDGKFQANILLEPHPSISLYKYVPKLYFPVLWFRERVEVPNYLAILFRMFLAIPTILICISFIMALAGIILITIVVYPIVVNKKPIYELTLQFDDSERPFRINEHKL